MCGIVAYVGHRQASEVIIKGLKRLEYRGYDSTGIALLNGALNVYKKKGKVSELETYLKGVDLKSHIGMGHTRWATHGEPSDENAHSRHKLCSSSFSSVGASSASLPSFSPPSSFSPRTVLASWVPAS